MGRSGERQRREKVGRRRGKKKIRIRKGRWKENVKLFGGDGMEKGRGGVAEEGRKDCDRRHKEKGLGRELVHEGMGGRRRKGISGGVKGCQNGPLSG